jgi:DNA repair photolyase
MAIDKSQRVGITEAGEVSFNLEVFDNLYEANIIITKRLTDALIDKLVDNYKKCILHLTVTGFGGSKIEPFTPLKEVTKKKLEDLLAKGFPVSQVVLRIDPIIPTDKGVETAISVLKEFSEFGIGRVRLSFLDMYKHVKTRFEKEGIEIPSIYKNGDGSVNFHVSLEERQKKLVYLEINAKEFGYSSVEVCGEPGIESVSCLSQKDIDILGLTDKIELIGNKGQRNSCSCPSNKTELLKVGRPHRCENKCLYCFWH